MTAFVIRIDELVLRGFPQEYGADIADLVTERLEALARAADVRELTDSSRDVVSGQPPASPLPTGAAGFADLVAGEVWACATGHAAPREGGPP